MARDGAENNRQVMGRASGVACEALLGGADCWNVDKTVMHTVLSYEIYGASVAGHAAVRVEVAYLAALPCGICCR